MPFPETGHPLNQAKIREKRVQDPQLNQALSLALEKRNLWLNQARSTGGLFTQIPSIHASQKKYHQGIVKIGCPEDLPNNQEFISLKELIKSLIPWRKGPFELFGHLIDAEWQSQKKWERLEPHLPQMKDKMILDIGCNSGYYMYRMLPHQPDSVLGIDPSQKFFSQFQLLQQFSKEPKLFFELMGLESLMGLPPSFDLIFCMGILYHRKDPFACIRQLKEVLKPKGTLILETLILHEDSWNCLCPSPSYGKMKNTYWIPTPRVLEGWLSRYQFSKVKLIDISVTSPDEQRTTEYCPSPYESLIDFLNPKNSAETIEGFPAPVRGTWIIEN